MLTASGGADYLWSTGDTTTAITVSPLTNSTYSVLVSNSICHDSATMNLTVSPAITVTASHDTDICGGQSVLLSASGGALYSWSNGATTDTITVNPALSTTYSVIVSSGACYDTSR